MQITVVRPWEWEGYCKAVGRDDFGADPSLRTSDGREPRAAELDAVLRPLLASDTNANWSAKFTANRIMHEALNSYPDFLKQDHVAASGAVSWTNHPEVPEALPLPNLIGLPPFEDGSARAVAPSKGQHGAEILAEHGYSPADISGDTGGRIESEGRAAPSPEQPAPHANSGVTPPRVPPPCRNADSLCRRRTLRRRLSAGARHNRSRLECSRPRPLAAIRTALPPRTRWGP